MNFKNCIAYLILLCVIFIASRAKAFRDGAKWFSTVFSSQNVYTERIALQYVYMYATFCC